MTGTPIYYDDQTDWKPSDFYALWRYFDRLLQYIGPTQALQSALDGSQPLSDRERARIERVAAHQAKRTGKRDEELSALDLDRMTPETRYLLKHMLIQSQRYDLALERFPNLRGLDGVGALGHPLYLDENPRGSVEYYTQVGIHL